MLPPFRGVCAHLLERVQLSVVVLDGVHVVLGTPTQGRARDDTHDDHGSDNPTDEHRPYSTGSDGCPGPRAAPDGRRQRG